MNTIIILCDIAETDLLLIEQAEKFAKKFESKIYLLHVAAPNPDFVGYETGPQHERDWRASTLKSEHDLLHKHVLELQKTGISAKALLVEGPTLIKLVDEVNLLQPDLVVVGNHQHSFIYRTFIGSISDSVTHKVNCPILLVPLV